MYVKRAEQREWMSAGYTGGERAILHINRTEGRTSLVRIKAGARGPRHTHGADEHAYVISGKVEIGGHVLGAGDYLYTAAGEEHALIALEDSVIYASTERPIQITQPEEAAATARA
jgi:quercetin dioxygenase-like cupin family protein